MLRKLTGDNHGSAWPVMIFLIVLCLASFLVLILGHVFEPFMNLMNSNDDTIDSDILAPRGYVSTFFQIVWPKGVLLVIFIGSSIALLMHYQKTRYQEVG